MIAINEGEIVRRYRDGESGTAIAKTMDVSAFTIYARLRKLGVRIQPKRMATCHPAKKNHTRGLCRPCSARDYRAKHWDQIAQHARNYYMRNKAKILAGKLVLYKANRERILWAHKFRRHGIDTHTFDAKLVEQNGVCAICKRTDSGVTSNGSVRAFAIDHNHATGQVRGLLCGHCNRGDAI